MNQESLVYIYIQCKYFYFMYMWFLSAKGCIFSCVTYIYISFTLLVYYFFLWGVAWWGWELEFILDNIERSVAIGDMNQYIWLLFSPYNEDKFRINFGCMHNLPCMQDVIVRKQIIINLNNHQICEYSMETGMVKSGFFLSNRQNIGKKYIS